MRKELPEIGLDDPISIGRSARCVRSVDGSKTGHVHPSTTWRWTLTGVGGTKLKSWFIGGRRVTTRRELKKFCDRIQQQRDGEKAATDLPAISESESDAELDAAGL